MTAHEPQVDRPRGELEALLGADAEVLELGGNRPLALDDPEQVWLVVAGRVELFALRPGGENEDPGGRLHLATAAAGRMLFGVGRPAAGDPAAGDPAPRLLAVAHPGTRLLASRAEHLTRLAREPHHVPLLAAAVETWVTDLFRQVRRSEAPRRFVELRPGIEVRLDDGSGAGEETPAPIAVGRTAAGVVWVRHLRGRTRFLGREELMLEAADALLPISDDTWLTSVGVAELSCVATGHLLRGGTLWHGLRRFHQLFLRTVALQAEAADRDERRRLADRLERDEELLRAASRRLAEVLGARSSPVLPAVGGGGDELFAVCQRVAEHQGIALRSPSESLEGERGSRPLQRIADASRVRTRRVLLREDWWRRDNGPLLAFLRVEKPAQETGGKASVGRRPVALLPTSPTSYVMVDPQAAAPVAVDAATAAGLHGDAHMFYRPLPERTVGPADLLRLALGDRRRDLLTLLLMGAAGGVLALMVPIITGELIGRTIPGADRPQLLQLTLALVVAALGAAAFQLTRQIAVLRLTGKIDGSLQAAVWDRLLALPSAFFRRYTVGDLTQRAMGVDAIRDLLVGNATTSLLGLVFSAFSFGLLFYYSFELALLASGLVAVLTLVTTALVVLQVRQQRVLLEIQGRIASLVFGLIRGIAKLRTAGAERRAFALWAERFAEQRRRTLTTQRLANVQAAFNALYGVATPLALFAMMGFGLADRLSLADFLAFSAAYGQVQAAALGFVSLISGLLTIVPVYERLSPILREPPEVDETKAEAGELAGDVEVSHVSFRYRDDGPLVLSDVSFLARPGEMVALVGPSGSGKSTLLRLLLGFEHPSAGSIYYDGQDLQSLDLQSVRRQIGVVLQNSSPMAGDIYTNIAGASNLGIDAAWEAATMAGLADDVRAMPMGMHTVISEGAATFSGGQLQRLMIARAIVHRPRLVFFDEATSALDNRTQAVVSRSIERLKATRIVIAHRLSTIENADRVVVLAGGRVVEVGTFAELAAAGGLFSRLVERQRA